MQKISAGKFHSALPAFRATVGLPRSLRLDVGRPDHLAPLLSFVGNELSKVGGRTCEHRTSQVSQALLHVGISERGIDLLVELLDNGVALGTTIPYQPLASKPGR